MRLLKLAAAAVLFPSLALTISCTRGVSTGSTLKLSLPTKAPGKVSGQSVAGELTFAVINVQLPGTPLSRHYEKEELKREAGQLILEVPNVPTGTFLVQFIGVYEDQTTGQRNFTYGDVNAVVGKGTSEAVITPAQINTSNRHGSLAGRLLTSATAPKKGPTGTLIMQYSPPGGKPKMDIRETSIVDGWFSLMALEGINFDYQLKETGAVFFKQIRLESSTIKYMNTSGTLITLSTTGQNLAKITVPQSFSMRNKMVQSRPATEYYVGYVYDGVTAGAQKVCYANDIYEGLPDVYTSATLDTPLDINTSASSTASQVQFTGASQSQFSSSQLYTDSATACMGVNEDQLPIYHTMFKFSDGDSYPLRAPFAPVRPFLGTNSDNVYLIGNYAQSNTLTEIKLQWSYLPGIVSIDGAAIFALNSTGGSGGGNDSCSDLIAKGGFREAGTATGAQNTFSFTGLPGEPLNPANRYNWQFGVCAYRLGSDGSRIYVGDYISGGRISVDSGATLKGWASGAAGSSSSIASSQALGSSQRIKLITNSDALSTQLGLGSTSLFAANDEVLVQFVGRRRTMATGSCGVHQGEDVRPGMFGFARVLKSIGNVVYISKGTFVDSIDEIAAGSYQGTIGGMSDTCIAQVTKVLHYRNLSLSSGAQVYATAFNYSNGEGGILAIRVNGKLTTAAGAKINADGSGFQGGQNSGYPNGYAPGGDGADSSNGMGGSGITSSNQGGGGGGGVGGRGGINAGSGATILSGGLSMIGGWFGQMQVGFGGGAGIGFNSAVEGFGGNGGGFVFVSVNKLAAAGALTVSANGGDASGGSLSTISSGGGGAGSVFMAVRDSSQSISGTLNLNAVGGAGGTHDVTNGLGGGGGGGGLVTALICDRGSDGSSVPVAIPAGKVTSLITGGQGWVSGTGNGYGEPGQFNIMDGFGNSGYSWACGYNN